MGGKLTLINSMLDALSTYMMSIFPAPVNVIEKIDALRRNFFWQDNDDKKKIHLGNVSRENNRSLMMKWLYRFNPDDNQLWKQVIKAKYGEEGQWTTKEVTTPYGCKIWRSVRNLWPIFQQRIGFKIGNGMKISFGMTSGLEKTHPNISFQNYTAYANNKKHQSLTCGQGKYGISVLEDF